MALAGVILGSLALIAAFAIPLSIERWKKPVLRIDTNELPFILSLNHQLLVLRVGNRNLPTPLKKVLQRRVASCSAKLTFYQIGKAEVYSNSKLIGEEESKMPILSSDALWATERFGVTTTPPEVGYNMTSCRKLEINFPKTVDIGPGGTAFIILPVKEREDSNCYLCNPGHCYLKPENWKNLAAKLEVGEYEIVLEVNCKGLGTLKRRFFLHNGEGGIGDFSLKDLEAK